MAEVEKVKGKKRKCKDLFVYGNYKGYYGYRIADKDSEDPRLSVLKKEWFEGKDCLDIGCNQGILTISIAKKFFCQSILGIDIDGDLVENAIRNLKKAAKLERVNDQSKESNKSVNCSECQAHDICGGKATIDTNKLAPQKINLFDRVLFRKENIVESSKGCFEKYDTILCLSVTKWIHFNWGDDGLITLFVKVWRLLRPGGIFVLEPQPWSSYMRKRLVSEKAKLNVANIELKPDLFQEILLDKIGFRTVENITENIENCVVGFNRPMYVYRK